LEISGKRAKKPLVIGGRQESPQKVALSVLVA